MFAQAARRDGFFVPHQLPQRGRRHDFPAVDARARPEINDVIGAAHRLLVVLDDQQRVAARLERVQRGQQLTIVARVQANGRLVQNVKHAAEIGAKLGRQADALGLAAGKGGGAAAQLQVAQSDLAQELQALPNLRQDVARDFRLAPAPAQARPTPAPPGPSRSETSTMVARPARARPALQADGARDGVQARALAIAANFPFALLPLEPGFLDGLGARPALDVRQVKQFAKAPAARTPAARGIVAEHLRVQRPEGMPALRTGALGRMDGDAPVVAQGVERAAPQRKASSMSSCAAWPGRGRPSFPGRPPRFPRRARESGPAGAVRTVA